METVKPAQCHLWQQETIRIDDLDFQKVEDIIDSSHFDRSIVMCKRCRQLYFHEFYEEVDWDKGNDKMFTTYIPIKELPKREEIEGLKEKTPLEILAYSPRLQWDSKNNDKIVWVGK